MDSLQKWASVDRYISDLFDLRDHHLEASLSNSRKRELPEIQVSYPFGQLLYLFAKGMGAHRILEVGTLGGFSTMFLARAVADGGMVYSLELEPAHAAVARQNLVAAGVDRSVSVIEGDAAESLARMIREEWDPFDFVFLDADKPGYTSYVTAVLELSRPGTVIIADNVVRDGEVVDEASDDLNVRGVREFNAFVASEPRLNGTIIQTVGAKGYDGFAVAVVA